MLMVDHPPGKVSCTLWVEKMLSVSLHTFTLLTAVQCDEPLPNALTSLL